jgi:SEC-C motif-containing protein
MLCPCCSEKTYENCCKPLIMGTQKAKSAQSMMRSRYTAYTQSNIDYIVKTMRGKPLQGYNKKEAKRWTENAQWQKLEIISSSETEVEFKAHFLWDNEPHTIHEHSLFKFNKGQWYYIGTVPIDKT